MVFLCLSLFPGGWGSICRLGSFVSHIFPLCFSLLKRPPNSLIFPAYIMFQFSCECAAYCAYDWYKFYFDEMPYGIAKEFCYLLPSFIFLYCATSKPIYLLVAASWMFPKMIFLCNLTEQVKLESKGESGERQNRSIFGQIKFYKACMGVWVCSESEYSNQAPKIHTHIRNLHIYNKIE